MTKPSADPAIAAAALQDSTRAVLRHWHEAVPDDRMAHLVRDAARGLTRALQFRLGARGIPMGHWVFLRVLWDEDGLSQRELAARAGLMESTAHTALSRMAALGYVTRRKRDGDRKRLRVFLTDQGRALQAELVPLAEDVNHQALAGLSAAEIATTRRVLLAVIENLALDEARLTEQGFSIPATRSFSRDKPEL